MAATRPMRLLLAALLAPGGVRIHQGMAFSQHADGTVHAGGDPAARPDALARVPGFIAGLGR